MRHLISIVLFSVFICSCSQGTGINKKKSEFNLNSDLQMFTKKMTTSDTIRISVDASGCQRECIVNHIITKHNDSVFISTVIKSKGVENGFITLPCTVLESNPGDTIDLESFFSYLSKRREKSSYMRSLLLSVTAAGDYIDFYSSGFNDRLKSLAYHEMIMRMIYPDEKFFKLPVPPTGAQTQANNYTEKSMQSEFNQFKLYELTDILQADFNGDGFTDEARFIKSESSGIIIVLGGADDTISLGFGKTFAHMTDFNWVDCWAIVNDSVTFEILFRDNEISGDTLVSLENPSIDLIHEEGSSGLITFKNGEFVWIHQTD